MPVRRRHLDRDGVSPWGGVTRALDRDRAGVAGPYLLSALVVGLSGGVGSTAMEPVL